MSSSKNYNKDTIKIYNFYAMSVYNLQVFEAKNLSTNLQEFLKIIVDSTINIGSNLRSTFNWPPHPNDDRRKIKNCYVHQNFVILDCTEISENSPEEISGGEKIIGIGSTCSPVIDVATVPPLHYGTTKRGSLYAIDDKILEVTANKWVRNSNLTNFRNVNSQAGAITVMDADSTEQQSVTQED